MGDWTYIDHDDELPLTPEQRGHRYHDGDVIVGEFRDDATPDRNRGVFVVVRFERHHGCSAYYDEDGEPLTRDSELVRWRWPTDGEFDNYEAQREAAGYPL